MPVTELCENTDSVIIAGGRVFESSEDCLAMVWCPSNSAPLRRNAPTLAEGTTRIVALGFRIKTLCFAKDLSGKQCGCRLL